MRAISKIKPNRHGQAKSIIQAAPHLARASLTHLAATKE
jgi:prephenate dehydrogenase